MGKNYLKNKREYLKDLKPYFTSNKFSIKHKSALDLDLKIRLFIAIHPMLKQHGVQTKWDKDMEEEFWDVVYDWLEPSKNNIVLVSNSERTKRKRFRIKTIFKKSFVSELE